MLLTVLIITMPTVAAALWQGSMGSFMHFSAFSGGGASSPGPQGQPPGSYVSPQVGKGSSLGGGATIASPTGERVSGMPQAPQNSEGSGAMGQANRNSSQYI